MCSPSAGPGARAGSPGVALSLTGTPSSRTVSVAPGCSCSTTISRARTSSELERLVEVEHRLQAAVVLAGERLPLRARALHEDRLHLAVRVGAGRARTAARSGPRGRRRDTTPARTSAPARRASPSRRRTGTGGSRRASPRARGRRAAAPCPRRSSARRPSPARTATPSAIETSTTWPSPVASRWRSAARIPNAAISAPPPMSAIWPAAWIGGPSGSPVSPSSPTRPR